MRRYKIVYEIQVEAENIANAAAKAEDIRKNDIDQLIQTNIVDLTTPWPKQIPSSRFLPPKFRQCTCELDYGYRWNRRGNCPIHSTIIRRGLTIKARL